MSLVIAGRGFFKVSKIGGGMILRSRLSKLGINEGSTLEVLSDFSQGPVMLRINGIKYFLGMGTAKKILVSPVCLQEADK
jgi:Fe2+ transport system protein FeoA